MPSPEDLEAEVRWLLQNQAGLDARLALVEDSLVFRTLRAIGRFYQTKIQRVKAGESRGYREWRARQQAAPPVAEEPTVSFDPSRPDGEWVGFAEKDARILPGALRWFAGIEADLIYSDEEVVDEHGAPLRPRFKPDWSPVLLRSVNYVGGLLLVRPKLVEEAGCGDGVWAMLRRIAERPVRAVHVPRVLYQRPAAGMIEECKAPPVLSTRPVGVVICTRNSTLLVRCLQGLRERTDYGAMEILVVRHLGSSSVEEERAVAAAAERFGAKSIEYSGAFNFSDMNNRGARAVAGEVLVFLNDDVEPISRDWLARLAGHLEDRSIGAAGAKLLYPDGAIQHAGIATWLIDGAGHPGRNLFASENWPWLAYTREVTAVTGACMAVRRADFERLGGFDAAFPVNFNDVDLCLRIVAAGMSIVVDVDAVLRHDESRTRARGVSYEERRLFFRRWETAVSRVDPYYSPNLAQRNEDLSLR